MSNINSNNEEYIEISITKMLVAVVKNIKTFVFFVVLGVVLTIVAMYVWQPSFKFSQNLKLPSYVISSTNGVDTQVPLLNASQAYLILQTTLSSLQTQNPDSTILNNMTIDAFSVDTNKNIKDDNLIFTLSVKSKLDSKNSIESAFQQTYKQATNSKELRESTDSSIQNLQNKYDASKKSIEEYNAQMKRTNANSANDNNGALIISYMRVMQDQNNLAMQLKTIQPNLQEFGDMTYSKDTKLSAFRIALLGVFLSLVIGFVAVFMRVIVRNLIIESKNIL